MTKFSSPSPKIKLLFFIACCAFINEGFADDFKWQGLQDGDSPEQTDLEKRLKPIVKAYNNDSGEISNYLDDKSCYKPKLQRDIDHQDHIFFSNETLFNRIEFSKMKVSPINAGSFIFQDDKEFTIHISNNNILSLHQGNGIINEGGNPVEFILDEKSTLNILGKPVDEMHSNACSSAPVHYQVKNASHLHFEGISSGEGAKVDLYDSSRLTLSNNNANSLGALSSAPDSMIELNQSSLILGNSGVSDTLEGQLIGCESSLLIKKGSGKLSLNGDCHAFEGTIIVNDGSVVLKKDLGGNIEVAGSPETAFEFHDLASAGSNQITVSQGRLLFKEESSANAAQITISNGELNFQDSSQGSKAAVVLKDKSKLTIGQNNSLGSLNACANSSIELNQHALTIGSLNKDDELKGEIVGNEFSQFIKEGTGTLSLYGKNKSFEGNMVIDGGKVLLSDSHLGGGLIVNKKGQLWGSGSIAKDLISNDGVINLSENDTLKISGNFLPSENSACFIKINNQGQNSKIEVEGKGILNNSQLHIAGDYRLCCPYEIFEAEEIEGSFQINQKEMHLPSFVELVHKREEGEKKIILKFVPDLFDEEFSSNQQNIALQLKKIDNPKGEHDDSLHALIELKDDIPGALDRLSGAQYTHLILAAERSTEQFIRRIYTPLRAISIDHDCEELCMNKCIAWVDVEAGKTFQKGKHGYDMLEYNVTAAIQKSMNDWLTESCPLSGIIPCTWLTGWTAGLAGSYSHQDYDFDLGGEARLHDAKGALYTLLTRSLCYLVLDFIVGSTTGKIERSIKCGRINEKAHGDIHLFQASFYGELGLNNIFLCDNLRIQPFVGIEAGYYHLGRCKEHGAHLFDLEIKEHSDCLTTSYLGLHFFNFQNDDCSWGISADVIWKHLFEYDNHLEKNFAQFGDKFKICGHQNGLNGIEGALTYFRRINDRWLINAEIAGEIWENYSNFYLSAGLSYKW